MASNSAYDRIEREIHEFERKLHQCGSSFSVSDFRKRFDELQTLPAAKKHPKISTVAALRRFLIELLQDTSDESSKGTTYKTATTYFRWFMEYWEYLKSLRVKFRKRVHDPLTQYFYDNGMQTPYNDEASQSERASSTHAHGDDVPSAVNSASRHLNMLRKEYNNARHLFDGRDVRMTATELQQVVSELDWLLQDDRDLSNEPPDGASSASKDFTTKSQTNKDVLTLCRLACDVLAKFQKAASLARRWVTNDRNQDDEIVNQLEQIKQVSKAVDAKLTALGQNISLHQTQLEREAEDLQYLLHREDRSNDLHVQLDQVQKDIAGLTESLDLARRERDLLAKQYLKAGEMDPNEAIALKIKYDQNRLKRYVLKRYVAAKEYKLALLQEDLQMEYNVKSSFVQYTNSSQDKYENLEQTVHNEQQEQFMLQRQLEELKQKRLKLHEEALSKTLLEASASEPDQDATSEPEQQMDTKSVQTDTESVPSAKPSKIPVKTQTDREYNIWDKALIPVEIWEKQQNSKTKSAK